MAICPNYASILIVCAVRQSNKEEYKRMDTDGDKRVTWEEIVKEMFAPPDAPKDGEVTCVPSSQLRHKAHVAAFLFRAAQRKPMRLVRCPCLLRGSYHSHWAHWARHRPALAHLD